MGSALGAEEHRGGLAGLAVGDGVGAAVRGFEGVADAAGVGVGRVAVGEHLGVDACDAPELVVDVVVGADRVLVGPGVVDGCEGGVLGEVEGGQA